MSDTTDAFPCENMLLPSERSQVEYVQPVDFIALLLADRRSENTRRAYAADLRDFFRFCYPSGHQDQRFFPHPELVQRFLGMSAPEMTRLLLHYKAFMMERGLSEATVNRRLAAVKSLVRFARRLELTDVVLEGRVTGERVKAYRDTTGIDASAARILIHSIKTDTLAGKRDFAMVLLLLENALRRSEIVSLRVGDYDASEGTLAILGKGRGTQREKVTLSTRTQQALNSYIAACRVGVDKEAPLFISLSHCRYGRALTADGLYKIIRQRAQACGLGKQLSPHRLRHTSITLALDLTKGDIRRVQRLSRHVRLETLKVYDDNRQNLQGEVSETLSVYLSAPLSSAESGSNSNSV